MGQLDTTYATPARETAPQNKTQSPAPRPKPAPVITDYASI